MFTGIVRAVGEVVRIEEKEEGRSFEIAVDPAFLEGVQIGASIAIDGACLTPVSVQLGCFVVQAVKPTLARTIAGNYRIGSRVNLERALTLNGGLDGHLVQGHVDGIGHVTNIVEVGIGHTLQVELPSRVARYALPQGSITLNGVSLTISDLPSDECIEVTIIPHTWSETNLCDLKVGDGVNVEGDLIGKYVEKVLEKRRAKGE